jgi:hypothetical protein
MPGVLSWCRIVRPNEESANAAPPRPARLLAPALQMALSASAMAAAVALGGWATGLREVLYGVLLSLLVFALLPFVIIAAGVALTLVIGILAGLAEGAGDSMRAEAGLKLAGGGVRLLRPYYRFLGRQRHPVLLGLPGGALLGALILWGALAAARLPREARTAEILAAARQQIEEHHRRTGRYPAVVAGGSLSAADLGLPLPAGSDGALLDGFGRPLRYQLSGPARLASYRLQSLGYDGAPGRDDLCVSGGSGLRLVLDRTALLLRDLAGLAETSPGRRLAGVAALRCPWPSRCRIGPAHARMSPMPEIRTLVLAPLVALTVLPAAGRAVSADACEEQRAQFPKDWLDVSRETPLFDCRGHYVRFRITIGRPRRGRTPVALRVADDPPRTYRALVPQMDVEALRAGRHVDLLLGSEDSCFIRGQQSGMIYLGMEVRTKERVESGGLGYLLIDGTLDLVNACDPPKERPRP